MCGRMVTLNASISGGFFEFKCAKIGPFFTQNGQNRDFLTSKWQKSAFFDPKMVKIEKNQVDVFSRNKSDSLHTQS